MRWQPPWTLRTKDINVKYLPKTRVWKLGVVARKYISSLAFKTTTVMSNIINELRNYNAVPRELVFDTSLSDRARFVYIFMACKPEDWQFFLEPMAKDIGYSVDTLRKYINELVASGWLVKGEQQTNKGVFSAVKYTLKATKFTDAEKVRHGENNAQYNSSVNNTDFTNKDLDIKESVKEQNKKENISLVAETESEFVDRIYKMYPPTCPVRQTRLGKSHADKAKIKSLLKRYSREEIEKVVKEEVNEKYGKHPLKNFSTFLNNFPDPNDMFSTQGVGYPQSVDDVKNEDNMPAYDYYTEWVYRRCNRLFEGLRGFPQSQSAFQNLVDHTIGGTKALCYVTLVLNRDGWEKYDDPKGFMFIYSNYIKANGLFKE